jgi:hypothetical protein
MDLLGHSVEVWLGLFAFFGAIFGVWKTWVLLTVRNDRQDEQLLDLSLRIDTVAKVAQSVKEEAASIRTDMLSDSHKTEEHLVKIEASMEKLSEYYMRLWADSQDGAKARDKFFEKILTTLMEGRDVK